MTNSIIAILAISWGLSILNVFPEGRGMKGPDEPDIPEIILGKWLRFSQFGPISLNFNSDGTVEGDLGDDQSVEIISAYTIDGDTIRFNDKEGVTCPSTGKYRIYVNDRYIAFDLIEDNCGGRIRSTMGFWVRPDFNDRLKVLSETIDESADPRDLLARARMYMAIGKSYEARQDFDRYLLHNPGNARIYVNRAGTRFPTDMEGVVEDCSKAISLEPKNKNAYFLRALALYELGEKKRACDDFSRAIELGFTILRESEKEKCSEYW